jgi:hypothetical protein
MRNEGTYETIKQHLHGSLHALAQDERKFPTRIIPPQLVEERTEGRIDLCQVGRNPALDEDVLLFWRVWRWEEDGGEATCKMVSAWERRERGNVLRTRAVRALFRLFDF